MEIIIKEFIYNLIKYVIKNPEECTIKFIFTFVSVFITAGIGWFVYKKQQKIKYVQEDINNFFYIFYLISKNFEEIINMYNNYSQKAILEINNTINALDKIKETGDKYHNKIPASNFLQFPDTAKEEFLQLELIKQKNNLILSVSFYRYYWYIDNKDFSKEALFLTKYGDSKFQAITIILHSVYQLLNELKLSISRDIDEFRNKPATNYNEIFLGDIRDNNYEEQINKYCSILKYKLSLFNTLNQELEKGLIYSRNALEHLQCFYNAFYKKYEAILKFIGVKYKEFGLANEIVESEKYQQLLEKRKEFEIQYWDIPDFERILNK